MKTVVTFGEVMGRLAPDLFQRFRQALPGNLVVTFGGAEANVAASVANLGGRARFVTALPKHAIADACVGSLRNLGVDMDHVVRTDEGRLGLYFLETGANQRPSNVIYDRAGSSVCVTPGEAYDWDAIMADAGWLHITGITPALSRTAAEAVLASAQAAKRFGLTVSCDLNFRKKLWRWDDSLSPRELAGRTMRGILPHVDVVVGNEEDASDVLGITAGDTDVDAGALDIERYPGVAAQMAGEFANVSQVAITLRESISASHNNWGAMLYDVATKQAFFAPLRDGAYEPYQIRAIVDRVGGGDSFTAGLIYALMADDLSEPQTALAFGVAASCLAQSIHGDYNYSTRDEVEKLMGGSGSGRVVR